MSSGPVRSRSTITVAYTLATVIGGISALFVLATTLAEPDSSVIEVLLWGALALLLFGSAVREWWFREREVERSRRIVARIEHEEIEETARASSSEVDTIRRLRVAHPGLRLEDARNLVKDHPRGADRGRS